MKRKWALGLCEGLMTQAVLSVPEVIIFLVFSCLLSNHHGDRWGGGKTGRKGIKKKVFQLFTPSFRKKLPQLPAYHGIQIVLSQQMTCFCWICCTYHDSPCHLQRNDTLLQQQLRTLSGCRNMHQLSLARTEHQSVNYIITISYSSPKSLLSISVG